jgi:putative oxidoreductase
MDIGLLVVRVVIAAILFFHATQKTLGWFSGPGLAATAVLFDALGQRPGRHMALVAAAAELAGAVSLGLGLLMPLGAAAVVGTMAVAGLSTTLVKGTPWNAQGGGEYPLVLAAVAAGLAFTGPGAWSIDALVGAPWLDAEDGTPAVLGVAALVLAVATAVIPLARGRRVVAGRRQS